MTGQLEGKTAIITGAGQGLGLEIARLFSKEGASVALVDINGKLAGEAASSIAAGGGKAIGLGADVCDLEQVQSMVKTVADALGTPDVLVNNAGIVGFGSVEAADPKDWNRVMDVNVNGTFLCSRAVLGHMRAKGKGSIVNIGSVAGMVGIPGMAAYCAAKGAVVNLTRQMAAEYAPLGIRVNAVNPGTVPETGMGQLLSGSDTSDEAQKRRIAKYPIGRFGKPSEIAAAVLFLTSDSASFVVGALVAVDGGMTAI